jgi:hypothetical protein
MACLPINVLEIKFQNVVIACGKRDGAFALVGSPNAYLPYYQRSSRNISVFPTRPPRGGVVWQAVRKEIRRKPRVPGFTVITNLSSVPIFIIFCLI